MTGQVQRVVLKINNEFYSIIIVDEQAYAAWRDSGDHPTSKMNLFIGDSIFKGKRRALSKDQASEQDIENAFEDVVEHDENTSAKEFVEEVKKHILLNGELAHNEGLESDRNSRNDARGGKALDTRGSRQTTGAH